jgi:hypothetical protein
MATIREFRSAADILAQTTTAGALIEALAEVHPDTPVYLGVLGDLIDVAGIEVRPNPYAGVDLADVVHIVGAETIEEYS